MLSIKLNIILFWQLHCFHRKLIFTFNRRIAKNIWERCANYDQCQKYFQMTHLNNPHLVPLKKSERRICQVCWIVEKLTFRFERDKSESNFESGTKLWTSTATDLEYFIIQRARCSDGWYMVSGRYIVIVTRANICYMFPVQHCAATALVSHNCHGSGWTSLMTIEWQYDRNYVWHSEWWHATLDQCQYRHRSGADGAVVGHNTGPQRSTDNNKVCSMLQDLSHPSS